MPPQGQVPVQEWKPGSVVREIYATTYAAAAPSAHSAELRLAILDPGTNRPCQLVNAAGAARHTLTTLKIAR